MKKYISLLSLLFLFSHSNAQYKVQFILKEKTTIHHDSIYVTGTFNNWDSTANKNYLMKPYGENEKSITLYLKGTIRYKFTRGNWSTVEKNYNGGEVPDRIITIDRDTTLTDSVQAWRDQIILDKKYALTKQQSDTGKIPILTSIAQIYAYYPEWYNADSAFSYAQKALDITQNIKNSKEYQSSPNATRILFDAREVTATLFHTLNNYNKSLELRFENLNMVEKTKNKDAVFEAMNNITSDYNSMKDYQNVLYYGKLMDSIASSYPSQNQNDITMKSRSKTVIAAAFYNLQMPDSALYYAKQIKDSIWVFAMIPYTWKEELLGDIYSEKGEDSLAFLFYRRAIALTLGYQIKSYFPLAYIHKGIAKLFRKEGRTDSAMYYARLSLIYFQNNSDEVRALGENANTYITEILPMMAEIYEAMHEPGNAYKYLQLSVKMRDSLYNMDKIWQFQSTTFNEAARRRQVEQARIEAQQEYVTKIKFYILAVIILISLVVAFMLFRNNHNKQRAYDLLKKQKQETEEQKGKAENALQDLKATQAQLIQSEKMASLGELTAGIAHEIQNPLNFVNNFSDVNQELLQELKEEANEGNIEEVRAIANDVIANEEKINHHGKRADAIVKGMLQHSRQSSGQKELTDINALADEYLRLSYHGLRAKDKNFNATFETHFDQSIGKINIIPQDIGRVLLNLFNNAFYAVNEQKSSNPISYQPTVFVRTQKCDDKIQITIRDNGNGIPHKILDKIFQPFFTTKPTGQGTGLGLSLSYDIVKAHGGEIKVESKEGEGSEFIIQLRCKN